MPKPTRTTLHLAWSNDGLNYLAPASGLTDGRPFHDDDGFTNDMAGDITIHVGGYAVQIFGRHRMITERGGFRREDEVTAGIRLQRTVRRAANTVSTWASLGAVATGPLKGAEIQDGFHRLIRWGRTLSGDLKGPLQNQYEGGPRAAPQLGVGADLSRKVSLCMQLAAGASVVLSHGVGVSSAQAYAGAAYRWYPGAGEITLFGQAALRHVHSEEERLTIPGGYPEDKTFFEPSLGIFYFRGATEIGFSLLLNIEGSGAHQGRIDFSRRL